MRRSFVCSFPAVVFAFFSALLVFSPAATAQTGSITGTVVDSDTGVPLAGAAVQVQGAGADAGALTNQAGRFSVNVGAGTYTVVVSNVGYRSTTEDRVRVVAGQATTLALLLSSNAFELNPIVVTVGRKAEKKTEAPASTHIVGSTAVAERPAVAMVEHIRSAPGVDIITSGVQSTNVAMRGFNNIFSGSLHALTDNRIAGIPSLRVNLLHFVPQTNDDIDRMEVVLGPGAALYGPNTANGILHIITKSPLDHQGTTLTFGGGEQGVIRGSLWTSHKLNDNFAVKVSSQYARGNEWEFVNPDEQAARAFADANPTAYVGNLTNLGYSQATAETALNRVGRRINDFERYSIDARADWQIAEDGRWVFGYGRTSASGIELTGLGAGQTDDWIYQFYQTRLTKGRFFAQAYLNDSDSGDSYLLNAGVPLIDNSRLFVTQAQYGFGLADGKEDITFGVDYFRTNPRTSGTINGMNEDIDDVDEIGAYIQSETALTDKLDLVLAGRLDSHSFLDDNVFSPRAALVFKPDDNSSFRVTYNQAFSPPSTLNLFLDISNAFPNAQLAALGYQVRATGVHQGFSFMDANGNLSGMRSPFTPAGLGGPSQLLPANVATLWQLAVGVLGAQSPALAGLIPLLQSLQPTAADIGINVFDPAKGAPTPLGATTIADVPKIEESTNETFEVGYQGVINNRLMISADVWYSRRENFVSPLVQATPFLMLNAVPAAGPNIAEYLIPILMGTGMPQAQAVATATAIAEGMGPIPLATVSSNQVGASGADVMVTYVNAGTVKLWGSDLAMRYFVDDRWTVGGTLSMVSDDYFADAATAAEFGLEENLENGVSPLALNAPMFKGSLSVGFRDALAGFNAEARFRFANEFPAESAGFVGTECVTGGQRGDDEEPCVKAAALVDLTLGYKLPNSGATLQLAATNLLDSGYRSFVGVPEIGRLIMLQVKYDLQ